MAILNLKSVPDELMEALRARAERNHRTVSGEVLSILETTVRPSQDDPEAVLGEILASRASLRLAPGPSVQQMLDEDRAR